APHEPGDRMHQMHQCGFAASEQPGMADGAAENAAEHIPPSLVRRINAIRQQECYGASVIGEHTIGCPSGPAVVLPSPHLPRALDDRHKEISVEVGGDALPDGGDPP